MRSARSSVASRSRSSCWSCGRSTGSRCWRTPPRTATSSGAERRDRRVDRTSAPHGSFRASFEHITAAGVSATTSSTPPGTSPGQPRHHRAPHRGAPQDHPRGARRRRPAARQASAVVGDPLTSPRSRRSSRCAVLLLWQTALLRLSKLRVRDEINEAIRYYGTSLFEAIPALTRELRRRTATALTARHERRHDAHDHDGLVDRRRPGRQSVRHRRGDAVRHRPTDRDGTRTPSPSRCTDLSRLLSMTDRLVTPTPELNGTGRGVGRRLAVPRRRAVPTGAARDACPPPRLRRVRARRR